MSVLTKSKVQEFVSDLSFLSTNPTQVQAFEKLNNADFPTTRVEYWKYTRLGKITNSKFKASKSESSDLDFDKYIVADNYIVVENGNIRKELSSFDLAEVNVTTKSAVSLNKEIEIPSGVNTSVFDHLNTAFIEDVIIVSVPKNTTWDKAVQVIYIQTGENVISNTRLIIESETSSSAQIISTFVSQNAVNCFTNHVTQISVAENSNIKFDKFIFYNSMIS